MKYCYTVTFVVNLYENRQVLHTVLGYIPTNLVISFITRKRLSQIYKKLSELKYEIRFL